MRSSHLNSAPAFSLELPYLDSLPGQPGPHTRERGDPVLGVTGPARVLLTPAPNQIESGSLHSYHVTYYWVCCNISIGVQQFVLDFCK